MAGEKANGKTHACVCLENGCGRAKREREGSQVGLRVPALCVRAGRGGCKLGVCAICARTLARLDEHVLFTVAIIVLDAGTAAVSLPVTYYA